MIFVGIDQSFTDTGIAVFKDNKPISLISLKSPKYVGTERLKYFYDKFCIYCQHWKMEHGLVLVGIEGYAYNKIFRAYQMGELSTAIALAIYRFGIPVRRYAPREHRKKALGQGSFKKRSEKITQTEVKKRIVLATNKIYQVGVTNHNIADAVCISRALQKDWEKVLETENIDNFCSNMSEKEKGWIQDILQAVKES